MYLKVSQRLGNNRLSPSLPLGENSSKVATRRTKEKSRIKSVKINSRSFRKIGSFHAPGILTSRLTPTIRTPTFAKTEQFVKPVMVNQATQFDLSDITQAGQYPLDTNDIIVLDPNFAPANAPERHPYAEDAENVSAPEGFFSEGLHTIADSLYWTVRVTQQAVRSFFVQTEGELLLALSDPNQQVRVSRSWLFGGSREQLFGLSNGTIHSIFVNWPKIFFQEKFPRSERQNTLALLQVVPHVVCSEVTQATEETNQLIENVVRKAAVVLDDRRGYNKDVYLGKLEEELLKVLRDIAVKVAPFRVDKIDHVKPGFEKAAIALNAAVEKAFPTGGSFEDRERYHIDARKLLMERGFRIGQDVALAVAEIQNATIEQFLEMPKVTTQDRKARVHYLAEKLIGLRETCVRKIAQFNVLLDNIDKTVSS